MKATRTVTVPTQRLSGEFMRHLAAAVLFAVIVVCAVGAALLWGLSAPQSIAFGIVVAALVKADDAVRARRRRRVTA